MLPLELRLLRALTLRLPPWPKMAGLAKHTARRWWLRRPRDPVLADVRGLDLELDPAQLVDGLLLFTPHLVDRAELAFVEDRLGPGDTFLDLGAYLGLYALVAARVVGPAGRVIAVEPEPESFARLRINVARNGAGVTCVRAAVSDETGTATLVVDRTGNRGSSTLLRRPSRSPGDRSLLEVPTIAIDALLQEHGIDQVDVAKLDLEGLEHQVLARWFDALPAPAWPRALVVEHLPERVGRAGGDSLDLLHRAGYRVRRASPHNVLAERP